MPNLLDSHWAPSGLARTQSSVTKLDELQRCNRLFQRVKWKSSLLLVSYQRAINGDIDNAVAHEVQTMFKVDFFEFYVLLERLLVHILGSFRVPINGNTSATNSRLGGQGDSTGSGIIIGSSVGPLRYHRFHAEVLQSFDQPSNPLHAILGVDPVRGYLQAAKDFRNKWKDAAESAPYLPGTSSLTPELMSPFDRLLDSLDLKGMLDSIIHALENVQTLMEKNANENGAEVLTNSESTTWSSLDAMDCDDEDVPWEAMPDGMDWEHN